MADGIRVLYVDDESSLLELAKLFLEQCGEFRVETATSARKVLDSSSIPSYDVVISDYQMPDMDGIAFLKAVREQFGDLPFILFTGRGREEVVISAINHGADFYLQKGGDVKAQFAELAHKIRTAVRRRETEQELRRSEFWLRSFVETTQDSVTLVDEEGRVTEWNAGTERITGIRKEEALGSYLWDLTFRMLPHEQRTEERLALIEQRIRTSLKTGIPVFEEPRVIESEGPDGSRIFTRQTLFPIRTEKGFGFGSIAQDITTEKRAENALRESEKKYHDLTDLLPLVVLEVDTNGNLTYKNRVVFQYFGYTEDDFRQGLNVMQMLVPGDVERAAAAFRAIVEGKEMMVGAFGEYTALRKDHSTFPISIYPTPIIVDGRITGVRGVVVDLTKRKRLEEALRDSEERFRGMTERSSDLILVLNKEMSPTYVSPSAQPILGFAPEELVGKPPEFAMATIFSETGPALMDAVKATMGGLPVENVELQLSRKDKTPVIVSMIAVPILHDGILEGVQVSMRDITESVVTQSALQAIVGSMVGTTGLNSLRKIAENVSSWLGADCVMVGEIQPDHETVKVLSMILDGKPVNDFIYHLKGTPCENVAEKGFCHYPDDAILLFPESRDLAELNIRGYIGTPLKNSDGNVIGILCALFRHPFQSSPKVQEIMAIIAVKAGAEIERSQMERALQESEEKFRSFVENANEIIFSLTPDGIFTYVSPNWTEWLGHDTRDVIGKSSANFIHPDDFPQNREVFLQTLATGKTMSGIEYRIRHKNGSWRWHSQSISLIRNTEGKVVAIQGIGHDITDRKRAEAELQKSQYLLSEALDMAQMADWEADALTGVFTFNDQFYSLYGTTAEREGGYQMAADVYAREFIHPDDRFMVAEEIAKALSTPESEHFSLREHRIIRRDGEVRWITVRVRVTKDAQGRIIQTHGANQDITDRKKAEEALRQANKKLNLLSGITRHDINNQLLVLNSYATLLQQKIPDTSYDAYFSRIANASNQITNMIQFTKEYEQIGVHAPIWQDIRNLVDTAVRHITLDQVTLKNDLPANMEVFADPLIAKVIFNLVDNAVRHGRKITTIRFFLEKRDGDRIIVCEDDGEGVKTEEKEIIFDLGFGKNTGFGLAISREILDISGITIKETGKPGKGARFEITVPKNQIISAA
jgi:PAS domain S-box-containing protein